MYREVRMNDDYVRVEHYDDEGMASDVTVRVTREKTTVTVGDVTLEVGGKAWDFKARLAFQDRALWAGDYAVSA